MIIYSKCSLFIFFGFQHTLLWSLTDVIVHTNRGLIPLKIIVVHSEHTHTHTHTYTHTHSLTYKQRNTQPHTHNHTSLPPSLTHLCMHTGYTQTNNNTHTHTHTHIMNVWGYRVGVCPCGLWRAPVGRGIDVPAGSN